MSSSPSDRPPLELWGGIESTYNRVGDRYHDQLARSGHDERLDDLDRIAELGIRTLRYPVLWERIAADGTEQADWSWPDARLQRLRELDLHPIAGLVHHGSGPRSTSLLDPRFPERLAGFASAVARRYPWIEAYTPVNEPLTTARFAGLYGHWYPHARDDLSFARALLTQCRATVLAMRAIRQVNPRARLVQTEDLGKTHSSARLAYQAAYENERRWVSCDLLTGRLTPDQPMWHWFVYVGVAEEELAWFLNNSCPPDILGFNTYLSSERYLDERLSLLPGETPGTNGKDTYVDVLAARVLSEGWAGTEGLLREAWDRYHLPLAVAETHNGGTPEEQIRWLNEVWCGAQRARDAGADVRAVTVWSLLGSYDWPSLVTRDEGLYEPGVFDIRAPRPRPTAVARMVRDLATTGVHEHPLLSLPGWWRRDERFIYAYPTCRPQPAPPLSLNAQDYPESLLPAVLILGDPNPITQAIVTACRDQHTHRRVPCQWVDTRSVDLGDPNAIQKLVGDKRVWAVVMIGSLLPWTSAEPGVVSLARAVAADPGAVPSVCVKRSLPLVVLGSDVVFDGRQREPYTESSAVTPVDRMGTRQAAIEAQVLDTWPSTLVVRSGPLFGAPAPSAPPAPTAPSRRRDHGDLHPHDETISPTYLPDLAHAVLDLLIDGEEGIWHLANGGVVSASCFQHAAAGGNEQDRNHTPTEPSLLLSRALGSERGWLLPHWTDALRRHRAACFPALEAPLHTPLAAG